MTEQDTILRELAQEIHRITCGCNDTTCIETDDIYNWLCAGDSPWSYTLDMAGDMAREWLEYSYPEELDEW